MYSKTIHGLLASRSTTPFNDRIFRWPNVDMISTSRMKFSSASREADSFSTFIATISFESPEHNSPVNSFSELYGLYRSSCRWKFHSERERLATTGSLQGKLFCVSRNLQDLIFIYLYGRFLLYKDNRYILVARPMLVDVCGYSRG